MYDRPVLYIRRVDLGITFLRIPKVASSSIKLALLGKVLAGNEGEERTRNNPQQMFPNDFIFAAVRNPWDRIVSCYMDKVIMRDEVPPAFPKSVKKGMPFADFVNIVADTPDRKSDMHFRSQSAFFFPQGRLAVNCLIRFERLQEDWCVVRGILAAKGLDVPEFLSHRQKRERAHYSTYYTDTLVDLVRERYKEDVKILNYEFK